MLGVLSKLSYTDAAVVVKLNWTEYHFSNYDIKKAPKKLQQHKHSPEVQVMDFY